MKALGCHHPFFFSEENAAVSAYDWDLSVYPFSVLVVVFLYYVHCRILKVYFLVVYWKELYSAVSSNSISDRSRSDIC